MFCCCQLQNSLLFPTTKCLAVANYSNTSVLLLTTDCFSHARTNVAVVFFFFFFFCFFLFFAFCLFCMFVWFHMAFIWPICFSYLLFIGSVKLHDSGIFFFFFFFFFFLYCLLILQLFTLQNAFAVAHYTKGCYFLLQNIFDIE